jgi:RNA-directed DNA polymerase
MGETLSSQLISTRLQLIAEQAKKRPEMVFTTLAHLMDVELLREAYKRTNKQGSPGVDGVTAKEYAENLEENLAELHERLRKKEYKAPPVKRTYLEKEDGSKRPIGKPAFEDKIVQRAVAMLVGAVYEQDFYDCSYGFRPGRSPHNALREVRDKCVLENINWIVDADVSGFFDSIPKGKLQEVIRQRVNDGGIVRLIGKWLNAGVLEGEELIYPETGTPQGGVITPPTML